MHLLVEEVLLQRPFTVVLERNVPVCGERAGEDKYVPEGRLKQLMEDIAHLVLEVLRHDERVHEIRAPAALERHDLAVCAGDVGVDVECLREVVYRYWDGLGADVEEDTDVALEEGPKGVEEPPIQKRRQSR
ncbi:hypothetical protein H0H92_011284 [Tricholoma furcatifolium]|nr:hypothetical protein H0H92_011284 [Tricholoma furcatifolium]